MLDLFQPSTFDVAQVFAAVDCFRSLKIVYSQLQVFLIVLTHCIWEIYKTKMCLILLIFVHLCYDLVD